jgi:hypothetical protein
MDLIDSAVQHLHPLPSCDMLRLQEIGQTWQSVHVNAIATCNMMKTIDTHIHKNVALILKTNQRNARVELDL